jgi:hypothetical protein
LLGLAFSFSHSYSQVLCKAKQETPSVWWSLRGLSDPLLELALLSKLI